MPEVIQEYFGDGTGLGVKISYSITDVENESGRHIKLAETQIESRFILMYCDNYWPLNIERLFRYHKIANAAATVTVYTNKDQITRNNICVNEEGHVQLYDKTRKGESLNGVEIGYFIIEKKMLNLMPDLNFSFGEVMLPKLISLGQLAGFLTDQKYYSVGSLDRLPRTRKFLQPENVIFLDRDGVINEKAPKAQYIKSWQEFRFIPGSIEAIKMLSQHNYKIFIITNQAGIARGKMTEDDLLDIHENLRREFSDQKIKIAGIYYCPHGWNDECECRKPKAGMFFQAANEHDLDLSKAIFIGDDDRDLIAGNDAGCKTILTSSKLSLLDIVINILSDDLCSS